MLTTTANSTDVVFEGLFLPILVFSKNIHHQEEQLSPLLDRSWSPPTYHTLVHNSGHGLTPANIGHMLKKPAILLMNSSPRSTPHPQPSKLRNPHTTTTNLSIRPF